MNIERVEALARLLNGARARELTVETEAWTVSLTKGAAPARLAAGPGVPSRAEQPPPSRTDRVWITAPMVGIFRAGDSRLQVGDRVEIGETLGAIESMKILNPISSEVAGEVTTVPVEDGQPVEYAQPLLEIRKEGEP